MNRFSAVWLPERIAAMQASALPFSPLSSYSMAPYAATALPLLLFGLVLRLVACAAAVAVAANGKRRL